MPGIALMHQLSAQRGSYYFYPHFSSKETEAQPGVTWLVIRAYAPRPCDFWGRLPQPWSHYGHWSSYMSVFSLKEGTVFVYGHAPTCWEHKRRYLITTHEVNLGRGIKEQPEWGAGEWIIMRWRKDFRAAARPGGNQASTACEAQVGLVVSHPPS